jgi:uncharacterized coiled-coil protein SlyX
MAELRKTNLYKKVQKMLLSEGLEMTPHELADKLIEPSSVHGAFCYEAANMLRQLAKEKAELEKGLELVKDAYCAKDSECKELKGRIAELEKRALCFENATKDLAFQVAEKDGQLEKQSEPVTYLKRDESTGLYYECDRQYGFPVYTTPQTKPLSDEDLDKLIKDAEDAGFMEMYIVGLIDGFNHAKAKVRGEK